MKKILTRPARPNDDIREFIWSHKLHLWQVAAALGMADSDFSRLLRTELPLTAREEITEVVKLMRGC